MEGFCAPSLGSPWSRTGSSKPHCSERGTQAGVPPALSHGTSFPSESGLSWSWRLLSEATAWA